MFTQFVFIVLRYVYSCRIGKETYTVKNRWKTLLDKSGALLITSLGKV